MNVSLAGVTLHVAVRIFRFPMAHGRLNISLRTNCRDRLRGRWITGASPASVYTTQRDRASSAPYWNCHCGFSPLERRRK